MKQQSVEASVIAIDAMGGDAGTASIVHATKIALSRSPKLQIVLVGDEIVINEALKLHGLLDKPNIRIRATSEVITMDDSPASVLRNKKDSSMRVAIEMVASREAGACVSAGNTGALMALSRLILKMLPGIDRPAICTTVPNKYGRVHWLDLGANIDSSSEQLYQFALMGNALCNVVDNIDRPLIGLLNIGSEAIKGNEQVKKTAELLNASNLNYIGFVEGDDIYNGKKVDVIVCDGFVGNIALKTGEGLARLIRGVLKESFNKNIITKVAAFIVSPILRSVVNKIDPGKYNGASLLGLNGIVIKSHGGADEESYANAIRIAELEVHKQLPQKIHELLTEHDKLASFSQEVISTDSENKIKKLQSNNDNTSQLAANEGV